MLRQKWVAAGVHGMSAPSELESAGSAGSAGSVRSDRSDQSPSPDQPPLGAPPKKGIRPSGGYRKLRSFQVTTIIYDATVSFCARFVDKRSRTVDQMAQAARSGRQNIAEGSRASATSSQTELRLVNVARSSLDELLLDYEDYLRQHRLMQWKKDDSGARAVREVGKTQGDPPDAAAYAAWLAQPDPAVMANAVICLIHQANYLLDRQIAGLERQFIHEGGYSERLAAARIEERQKQRPTAAPTAPEGLARKVFPACPLCARPMALRTARKGKQAGSQFWGCTAYPACKGTRPMGEFPSV
jgi:four helix bundle suffix protein